MRRATVGCLLIIAACSSFSSTTPGAADLSDGGTADGKAPAETGEDAGAPSGEAGGPVDACAGARRFMFVTADLVSPSLGGQAGAASHCTAVAVDAGLPGHYIAWLSLTTAGPGPNLDREPNVPIVLPDCEPLAADLDYLLSKGPETTPNVTERGLPLAAGECDVWSSTQPNGAPAGYGTCTGWESDSGAFSGLFGRCDVPPDAGGTKALTYTQVVRNCDQVARLYCLQN